MDPDPWAALVGFLERLEEGFVANRALEHLVLHTDRGRDHVARARERMLAPLATLVERAKAGGRLRADFEAADIGMIHTMLAAVVRETHAGSPDLWRRYFVMLVDGLATARTSPSRVPDVQ